ncbi:sigma-70 family RNA polymerase sigma factor [Nonlabens ponticola]|uniref:Sigma-70 family RNA polymerase sigma factor n=2 Tax=Nonlabens ponticola TaxID=2496866 RepID=A0A3S9N1J3_9FLAO|nr:sigma-70 family RNA polymerase sigma factor [Nonlabens ponticola]
MKVYNDYARGMYNVSLRIVQDTAQAEDIMQESMITAFAKMADWNRTATFGSWLKRIVVNNSLTYLRKNKRMPMVAMDDEQYEQVPDDEPLDLAESGATATKVLEVMKTLKESYRQILNLHLIEGMDNEEISHIMNISHGMCRTTLSRAKTSLKNKMQAL